MNEVKIINHNEETLRGRFNGEDFEFKPEVATVLSLDAARHIFGLGHEDKSNALNALGWFVPGGLGYKDALAKLDNISFVQGRTVYDDDEPLQPDTDDVALDRPRSPKTGGRPHVTGPGGEKAAGSAHAPAASNPSD